MTRPSSEWAPSKSSALDSVALDYPEDRNGSCHAGYAASVNFVTRNGQSRQQVNRADSVR